MCVLGGLAVLAGGGCVPAEPILPNDADADGIFDMVDPDPTFPTPQTLQYAGRTRAYTVRLPQGYDGAQPLPLVLALHGTGQTPRELRDVAELDAEADANNLIFVFPEAVELNWNDGREVAGITAYDEDVDDVGFLDTLIGVIDTAYNVDETRVYSVGFSNGGIMCMRLGLEAPAAYAALGSVKAALPVELAERPVPAIPTPFIFYASTTDPVVPFEGGTISNGSVVLGTFLSVPETVAARVNINGASAPPLETPVPATANDGTTATQFAFTGDNPVEYYEIAGAGHNWPGGPRLQALFGPGSVSQEVQAAALTVDFFLAFSR